MFSSASLAVQTMPMMDVETVEMVRVPSLISMTLDAVMIVAHLFNSVVKGAIIFCCTLNPRTSSPLGGDSHNKQKPSGEGLH